MKLTTPVLTDGLTPLLYISDDEPSKIRKLQADVRAIQREGVSRLIRVLYPAPPMANATSLKHTSSTRLLNPNIFPITGVHMYSHPCTVSRSLGKSYRDVHRRFMVITLDTAGANPNYPVRADDRPVIPGETVDDKQRSEMLKHNILLLVEKNDKRLHKLKKNRHAGCRITTVSHPSRQRYSPLLMTFNDARQAQISAHEQRAFCTVLHAERVQFAPA